MTGRHARFRNDADELIDRLAIEEFSLYHQTPTLHPVAVVIAAWKEAENIAGVLEGLPAEINGAAVSVIVSVDGDDDGASELTRQAGAMAVVSQVHRGQGAALRLAYRAAREFGAKYVVTCDADGQTDPNDLAVALKPVMDGEKDFVNGSRRLGSTHGQDPVRNCGVIVFGTIMSFLTRTKITDPAATIRAFSAELTAGLTLDEHQFQGSEILITAITRGHRFGEVPVTMLNRRSGASKKGRNLSYGYNYARAMTKAFWRERLSLRTRYRGGAGRRGATAAPASENPRRWGR